MVTAELPPPLVAQSAPESWGPAALDERRQRSARPLARLAEKRAYWIDHNRYYYGLLIRLLLFLIEPGKRILFVRCSTASLLASLEPAEGVGLEISQEMIDVAQRRYPEFTYKLAFPDTDKFLAHFQESKQTFDYVVFSDIDDTVDVQSALQNLRCVCDRHTRVVITTYNKLWEPFIILAEWLGMKVPRIEQNWLSGADIRNLLSLSGYESLVSRRIVL